MSSWGTFTNYEVRHTVFSKGEWGVLYAQCADCRQLVRFEIDNFINRGAGCMEDIQMLMDRHCKTPNAHAEKVVRQGFLANHSHTTTPYIYELKR